VVGGLKIIDQDEADDKIIAVLAKDNIWGQAEDLSDLPQILIERLSHYFGTYKLVPGKENLIFIEGIYDCQHALKVVEAALQDYDEEFGRGR